MKLAGALLILQTSQTRAKEALLDDFSTWLEDHTEDFSGDGAPTTTTELMSTTSTEAGTTQEPDTTSVPITDDPLTTTTTTSAPTTTTAPQSWLSEIEEIAVSVFPQFIAKLPGDRNSEEEDTLRSALEDALSNFQPGDLSYDYTCTVHSVEKLGQSSNFKVKLECIVNIADVESLDSLENEEALLSDILQSAPAPFSNGDEITEWQDNVVTYSYETPDSCDADNNGCAYDCFEGVCICPICWELDEDGKSCKPETGRLNIGCSSDKMHVWIDSCVIPHAGSVYIGEDDCTGEKDGNIYHLTSPLDGCGTSLAKQEDGQLKFSNSLIASARKNSLIRLGPETQIDLSCRYDSVYDNITAITTIDSNDFSTGGEGSGKLKFHITSYTDETFEEEISDDHTTKLGSKIFFGVKIDQPIDGVEFAISDCKVVDEQLGLEHSILADFCPDNFVEMAAKSTFVDKNEVFMSYKSFLFVTSEEEISELKLVCQAVACATDDFSSECQSTSCLNRRGRLYRRSAGSSPLEENSKIYTISMNLKHRTDRK